MASFGRMWVGMGLVGCLVGRASSGNYADQVVEYVPGDSASGYVFAATALGQPSLETDDPDPEWGGLWPVDPTSPPYLTNQIVELGAGGRLTLRMERPLLDRADPRHPYGIDLLVFGNAFFAYGSSDLSGHNLGATVVSVSDDGEHFYRLVPPEGQVAIVDGLFPTDGQGDFGIPVNPGLRATDFLGLDLDQIRDLYAGSGGGAGFDLAWAVDGTDQPVMLPWVRYVRFEQLTEKVQIDAVSGVGPRDVMFDDFGQDPSQRGWRAFGEATLFAWRQAGAWMDVTWDSAQPNSYWYRPLGTVLSRVDDFTLAFDLRLDSIQPGSSEDKPYAFQIALGLLQLEAAARPEMLRGTGVDPEAGPRNTLEFDYFPDTGYGATVSPTLISVDNRFASGFDYPVELPEGDWMRVVMDYTAADATLRTRLLRGGAEYHAVKPVTLPETFTDFRFDAVALCSFSDAGQDPLFAGSVLAQGAVDNVLVELPDPPVAQVVGGWVQGTWEVTLATQHGWTYLLDWTTDFESWAEKDVRSATEAWTLTLRDNTPEPTQGFYRVRAIKP